MLVCRQEIVERIPKLVWDIHVEKVAALIGRVEGDDIVVEDVWPAENRHEDPSDNFHIGRDQWQALKARAAKKGLRILGWVHSHPPGATDGPSGADRGFVSRYRLLANAVLVTENSTLVWYDKTGETGRQVVRLPLLQRLTRAIAGTQGRR